MAADDNPERILEMIKFLMQNQFRKQMKDFVNRKSEDVNFIFWWRYMEMVS